MTDQAVTTRDPDQKAYDIAMSIAALIDELKQGGNTKRAIDIAEAAKDAAEQLCDDLDPCNPHSYVAPLYPSLLGAAQMAARYGGNVLPFTPR